MKRGNKNVKTKYGIAVVGMLILALFLALSGYFVEQTGDSSFPTGWKFYVPIIGALGGIVLIIYGLIVGKRRKV